MFALTEEINELRPVLISEIKHPNGVGSLKFTGTNISLTLKEGNGVPQIYIEWLTINGVQLIDVLKISQMSETNREIICETISQIPGLARSLNYKLNMKAMALANQIGWPTNRSYSAA